MVEEEDEEISSPPPLPSTPANQFISKDFRIPNTSTAPSEVTEFTTTSGIGVPLYLSHREASRNDIFPSSPFSTPLKEKISQDDDEEEVVYNTVSSSSPYEPVEREISWIASPST